jgi:hypothetical protein
MNDDERKSLAGWLLEVKERLEGYRLDASDAWLDDSSATGFATALAGIGVIEDEINRRLNEVLKETS